MIQMLGALQHAADEGHKIRGQTHMQAFVIPWRILCISGKQHIAIVDNLQIKQEIEDATTHAINDTINPNNPEYNNK